MELPEDIETQHNFQRVDESNDTLFYEVPRLVIHVDQNASNALAEYFRDYLPKNGIILDLMSSFSSHLPNCSGFSLVCGLGLNKVEMEKNPQLSSCIVHDLNTTPILPFAENVFDSCLLSFSVQYLIKPVSLITDIGRILKPAGFCHIAFSNRMFPSKAVAIWQAASDLERANLITRYFDQSKIFDAPKTEQLVKQGSGYDPLYVVRATRKIVRPC